MTSSDAEPTGDPQELARKAAERDEVFAQLQRVMADFQNFQKRASKERSSQQRFAIQGLVEGLLPILDHLQRAIAAAEASTDTEPTQGLAAFLEGIHLVEKELLGVLAEQGLRVVEAKGHKFDPAYHQAVAQEEAEVPDQTILRELTRGYQLHERIIRPAQVIVSSRPGESGPEGAGPSPASDEDRGAASPGGG